MLQSLSHQLRHGAYLRNEQGIKKFAEQRMGKLIRKVTKKSAFYREMNENLLVEKANLRLRSEELAEQPVLEAGAYFRVRRRVWLNSVVIGAALVSAVFLNVLSVSSFLQGQLDVSAWLRWFTSALLALILTGGGLVVAARLIEALLGPRHSHGEDDGADGERQPAMAVLWLVLLGAIEVAILGVAEVRARALGGDGENTWLFLGFITLLMLLPLLAGAIHWDTMRFIKVYKTTLAQRAADKRLAQINSILRQNEEYESNFYKIKSTGTWEQITTFKTHKENRDAKQGVTESLEGHYAHAYDAFQAEAYQRYEADIRDLTTASMRRLPLAEQQDAPRPAGQKLNNADDTPMPADSGDAAPRRRAEKNSSDDSLVPEPKPVR